MTLSLSYAAQSHIGLVRNNNQDSGIATPAMLIVADGMGGAAAGDLASALTVREFQAIRDVGTGDELLSVAATTLTRSNQMINEAIQHNPKLDGMGATATGVFFDGQDYGVINIGDSRTYLLRDGHLTRLTHDHSWVQSLIDDGQLTEEEALHHPKRSVILKVLNGLNIFEPDLRLVPAQAGDRILVCSDGLSGLVPDPQLALLLAGVEPATAVHQLMQAALAGGGHDNITILVADVSTGPGATDPIVVGSAATLEQPFLDEATAPIQVIPRPDPQAAEIARYQPTARRSNRVRSLVIGLVLAVALIGIVGVGGKMLVGALSHHYIAPYTAATGDYVGIFYGVPKLPFGKELVAKPDLELPMVKLTKTDRNRVLAEGHVEVASPQIGLDEIEKMRKRFQECVAAKGPANPTEPASPHPSSSGSAAPSIPATSVPPTVDGTMPPSAGASATPPEPTLSTSPQTTESTAEC